VSAGTAVRGPGRPRDERATEAITKAALHQLETLGYGRLTMDSVATESGVARATVYRRYRDKADLVTSAIATRRPQPAWGRLTPRQALIADLEAFDATFADSCITVLGALMGDREDPHGMELHRQRVMGPHAGYVRGLLTEAVAQGELREDADLDLALHLLLGAVIARRICGVASEPGWAARAVDGLWEGLGAP
jgi:AcrR family transcriptional regulator